jgi:DNA-binding winged helix-turn-helix (wHTH) protein
MAQAQERPNQAADDSNLYFGPFRLERNIRLWRGEQVVEWRPRSLAVLRYLAARPGQLVTEEQLLKRLWPGIYVTKTRLQVCVHAIRQALQEGPSAPAYIQTVGRHGYRFIGAVSDRPTASGQQSKDTPEPPSPPSHVTQHT